MVSALAGSASCGGTVAVWDPAEEKEADLRTGGDHYRGHLCFQVYQDLQCEHRLFKFKKKQKTKDIQLKIITLSNEICFKDCIGTHPRRMSPRCTH